MSSAAPGVFTIPSGANPKRHTAIALFAGTAWRVMPDALARELGIPGNCLDSIDPAIVCGEPARPGDAVQLYVTGLGKATPNGIAAGVPLATGAVAPADGNPLYITVLRPQVTFGGIPAEVLFSGVAPGFAGFYQINVRIPESASSGDDVPLRITMPNGQVDASTSIAIASFLGSPMEAVGAQSLGRATFGSHISNGAVFPGWTRKLTCGFWTESTMPASRAVRSLWAPTTI